MTKSLTPLPANLAFNFANVYAAVNNIISTLANEIVTANSAAGGGAMSAGNGFVTGIFGANTLVTSLLQGGNVTSSGTFYLGSNLNTNSATIIAGAQYVNSSSIGVFETVFANTTGLFIGWGNPNTYLNGTAMFVGNSTTNSVINSSSLIVGPNCVINSAGFYYNGLSISSGISAGGANNYVQINESGNFSGSAGFQFTPGTNTVAISNALSIGASLTLLQSGLITSGANVSINTTAFGIGNSTINAIHTSASLTVQTNTSSMVANASVITLGNSSVNATINSTYYSGSATYVDGVAANGLVQTNATSQINTGYTFNAYNVGIVSGGSFTPNAQNGNYQYMTANGGFQWNTPSQDCAIDTLITNGTGIGAIVFSGFTVGITGASLTTTPGNQFIVSIRRINGVATYSVYALQ
jgi:hypothetical protein